MLFKSINEMRSTTFILNSKLKIKSNIAKTRV